MGPALSEAAPRLERPPTGYRLLVSPNQAQPNGEGQSKRQTAARRAAARRRRSTAQRTAIKTKTNRVASELERFQQRGGDLRSRAERIADRVRRLA